MADNDGSSSGWDSISPSSSCESMIDHIYEEKQGKIRKKFDGVLERQISRLRMKFEPEFPSREHVIEQSTQTNLLEKRVPRMLSLEGVNNSLINLNKELIRSQDSGILRDPETRKRIRKVDQLCRSILSLEEPNISESDEDVLIERTSVYNRPSIKWDGVSSFSDTNLITRSSRSNNRSCVDPTVSDSKTTSDENLPQPFNFKKWIGLGLGSAATLLASQIRRTNEDGEEREYSFVEDISKLFPFVEDISKLVDLHNFEPPSCF